MDRLVGYLLLGFVCTALGKHGELQVSSAEMVNTINTLNVGVKSYGNSFLDPTCVPVRILINKLDLIPDRIVAGLIAVFRNSGSLGTGESYIPVVFFDPLLHRSPCFPNVDFAALTGNPVDNTILFSRVDSVLWSH